jgi:signal transduction histidine kinase
VFDPFAQVDASLNRAEGGLGLGLAIVRSVLHLHGGTVEAKSAGLGHGTTFVVRLPRLKTGITVNPPPPQEPPGSPKANSSSCSAKS